MTVRLRQVILVLAALAAMATAAELALIEHWASPAQLIPWVTLGVVVVAVAAVAFVPRRWVLLGARVVALLAIGCATWGFVEHLLANRDFAMEIHPGWGAGALLWAGISGNLPVLAPLAVAFPAMLVAAATLAHPGLQAVSQQPTASSHQDERLPATSVAS